MQNTLEAPIVRSEALHGLYAEAARPLETLRTPTEVHDECGEPVGQNVETCRRNHIRDRTQATQVTLGHRPEHAHPAERTPGPLSGPRLNGAQIALSTTLTLNLLLAPPHPLLLPLDLPFRGQDPESILIRSTSSNQDAPAFPGFLFITCNTEHRPSPTRQSALTSTATTPSSEAPRHFQKYQMLHPAFPMEARKPER